MGAVKQDVEMAMVPYLTVSKGDEILDTVCLAEQTLLLMGRHHTCDLVVGHASSSRQHVEIQIIHATREVVLTDLCSVHGTWVDGNRLDSMTPTLRKDSLTFQLGASRRVYRIDWQAPTVSSGMSSDSGSELGSSAESFVDVASQRGYRLATSALRSVGNSQEFAPSAPYATAVDNIFFAPELCSSPAARSSSSVKRSPARPSLEARRSVELRKSIELRKSMELRKSLSSPKILFPQDENASPGVRQSPMKPGQLARSASSPPRSRQAFAARARQAFAALQPSDTNARSPRSPSVKAPLMERSASSASLKHRPASPRVSLNKSTSSGHLRHHPASPNARPKPTAPSPPTSAAAAPSNLWLRRCSSAPLPALATGPAASRPHAPRLSALKETGHRSSDSSRSRSSSMAESGDAEFPADKENVAPKALPRAKERDSQGSAVSRGSSSFVESIAREPFRPLHYTATLDLRSAFHQLQDTGSTASFEEEDHPSKALSVPRPRPPRTASASQNLDLMLRRLRVSDSFEGRRQWHIIVDTNSLVDADSLKALKQLEGIRETCLVIPKNVVVELDRLKQTHALKSSARVALKWIEACMVKLPTWIHVQSSAETLPVGATPPVSPSMAAFPHRGDLMSPTNDDHVLECALIFAMSLHHGRVAVATRDTALKIKAMAEGLVAESAVEFCESLLSPYSSRFLWVGSTAHGKTWVDRSGESSPASSHAGELRPLKSNIKHSLEDLRHHVDTQPRGLKLV